MRTRIAVATVVGCVASSPMLGVGPYHFASAAAVQSGKPTKPPATEFATVSKLPSLGGSSEAYAVNAAGTAIVGRSSARDGLAYAVKWTVQNGSWAVTTLAYPSSVTTTGVADQGHVVGHSYPAVPVLWPAGRPFTNLGCNTSGEARAISADGKVVVGHSRAEEEPRSSARAWSADSPDDCGEILPPLGAGGGGSARAVNADGSIIGGVASSSSLAVSSPTVWVGNPRQTLQLDTRAGSVFGANARGDLAGYVIGPCALAGGCQRAIIWYAAATGFTAREDLGTLGGTHTYAHDINSAGEVVGMSSPARGNQTGFFWTPSTGMLRLSASRSVTAYALSDVRSDGTRLVVGVDDQATAAVWVVRIP